MKGAVTRRDSDIRLEASKELTYQVLKKMQRQKKEVLKGRIKQTAIKSALEENLASFEDEMRKEIQNAKNRDIPMFSDEEELQKLGANCVNLNRTHK